MVAQTVFFFEIFKFADLDAVARVKQFACARFDETVDLAVKLGVDPRKPNQSIKGVARLPHGNGKKVRVAVFASGNIASPANRFPFIGT